MPHQPRHKAAPWLCRRDSRPDEQARRHEPASRPTERYGIFPGRGLGHRSMRPPLSWCAHTSPELVPTRPSQANRLAIWATVPDCRFRPCWQCGKRISESPRAKTRLLQPVLTLLRSFFALSCGRVGCSPKLRESCGSTAQQAGVALQRQCGNQILFQRYQRDTSLANYKLASLEGMLASP